MATRWPEISPTNNMPENTDKSKTEQTPSSRSPSTPCSRSSDTPESLYAAFDVEIEEGLYETVVPVEVCQIIERERNDKTTLAMGFAGDLAELRNAVRNLRDVSGRHHSQIACERLFALLPENAQRVAPPGSGQPDTQKGN